MACVESYDGSRIRRRIAAGRAPPGSGKLRGLVGSRWSRDEMIELGKWRRWALGILGLAIAACTMDTGSKPAGDGGDDSVEEAGGSSSGETGGSLTYLSGGTSALPAGGSLVTGGRATGGMRATGGIGPRTCACACYCGTCSTSTTSGNKTKSCGAGDPSCVDCYAPCQEFCGQIGCTLVVTSAGACDPN